LSRVLIVSYFYPPCNLTGGRRPASWVRYLPQFGFQPVVVTRRWDHPIAIPSDMFIPTGSDLQVERKEDNEVRRVPHRASLRDRIYIRYGESRAVALRKSLSLSGRLLDLSSTRLTSYRGLLAEARAVLSANPDIRHMVISAGPFPTFGIGHAISRSHPRVRWIADYRDEWTTCLITNWASMSDRFLRAIERRVERAWVGTASMVTTVNEDSLLRIAALTGRPGAVLLNGFDEESLALAAEPAPVGVFRITHAGTLYPTQPIEVFLHGALGAMRALEGRVRIEVQFPGLAFSPEEVGRVERVIEGPLRDRFFITPRIPHSEALALERSSHVLLLVGHRGRADVPSSKLYEYVGLRKPVLLSPSDSGVMEQTLRACGLAHVASTSEEVEITLTRLVEDYLATGSIAVQPIESEVRLFSRRRQAERLADLLRQVDGVK